MPAVCTLTLSAKQGLIKIEEPDVIASLDLKNKRIQIKRTTGNEAITLELTGNRLLITNGTNAAKMDVSLNGLIEVTDGNKTASIDLDGSGEVRIHNSSIGAKLSLANSGKVEVYSGTTSARFDLASSGRVYITNGTKTIELAVADFPQDYTDIKLRELLIPDDIVVENGRLRLHTQKRLVACSDSIGSGTSSTGLASKNVVSPADCPA